MNYFKTAKFFLYLVPFTVVIVSNSTLFPFIVGKYSWFRAVIDLSFLFFLLGLLLDRDAVAYKTRLFKWLKSPLCIAISIFAGVFIVSSFFAFDSVMAFWSNFERGEGAIQILHLFLFFILLGVLFRDEKDWRKIFWLSIIAGFLMIFYGVGAGLKYTDAEFVQNPAGGTSEPVWTGKGGILFHVFANFIGPSFKDSSYRFQGSIGNPAYVATYLIFMFFYAAYLFLNTKNHRFSPKNILLLAFSLIFLVFFVFAGTRGAFVGLSVSAFLSALFLAITVKRWRTKLTLVVTTIIFIVVLGMIFKETPIVKSIPALRIFDISFSARTFQDRTYIWKAAWAGFKERPIFGWGPEGFSSVFDRHFPNELFSPSKGFGAWFDRAHNIFFDYLVETGVLGLLSYLSIFLIFYFLLFGQYKRGNKNFNNVFDTKQTKTVIPSSGKEEITKAIIFALPIAYLIQGLVLFEVLLIYLNIFLFFGFVNYKFNYDIQDSNKK